jgi:ribose 5-phosphate isomerase B
MRRAPMRIGIACDHGGFDLKKEMVARLKKLNYELSDYGAGTLDTGDDYPDYVLPLATAVSSGEVDRGIAICGSGVGASVAVNKIKGVRGALIHDCFSAHQGVEDDDINVICLGGRVVGNELAWEIVETFLSASFSGAERHRRRLAKVAALENKENHR